MKFIPGHKSKMEIDFSRVDIIGLRECVCVPENSIIDIVIFTLKCEWQVASNVHGSRAPLLPLRDRLLQKYIAGTNRKL